MADAKWIKVAVDMFDDSKLKIINSMDNRDLINYVWIRSLLLAGQSNMNGCLYINDNISYTLKTLAIEFDRTLDEVKSAFKILKKLEMIEFTKDKVFKVKNWARHQSVDELEKLKKQNCERVAKHRAKKKELEKAAGTEIKNNSNDKVKNNIDIEDYSNNQEGNIDKQAKDKHFIKGKNSCENVEQNQQNIKDITNNSNDIKDDYDNAHFENLKCVDKKSECNSYFENMYEESLKNIDNCNITCNVTENEIPITVMEQNKKENKNKKKNKREKDKENLIINSDINTKGQHKDYKYMDIKEILKKHCKGQNDERDNFSIEQKISKSMESSILSESAAELSNYYEQITGKTGSLDVGSLRLAIATHGEVNVKKAIDEAIKTGKSKSNMRYINGILRNWKREGYPEDDVGGMGNGADIRTESDNQNSRKDSKEFKDFKPKECRKLTDEERRKYDSVLI